jgi:hypothetical protein
MQSWSICLLVLLSALVELSLQVNLTSSNVELGVATKVVNSSSTSLNLEYYKSLAKKMNLLVAPILLVVGGIGNPLCIAILLRKKEINSTIVYFCILAVFDILVLFTGLFRQYLKEIANIDVREYSSFNCKIHVRKIRVF